MIVQRIEREKFDFMLDLVMPEFSGHDVINQSVIPDNRLQTYTNRQKHY